MWERSAPSTSSKKLWEGRDSFTVPGFPWLSHLHGPVFALVRLLLDPQTFHTEADISLNPAPLPFLGAAWIEGQFASPRLASSPVPKNGKGDCAGKNASSNFPSSRFASVHPACQLRVAPRLNASSRKRAP